MPCTPQMIENAIERLSQIRLNSFTAAPNNVRPGSSVTLSWSITNPANVSLKLNGVSIQSTGSKTVNPIGDTRYTIIAEPGCNIRSTLRSVLVNVDESSCRLTSIDESVVRALIINSIDSQITEHNASSQNDLSKRRETSVEIDPSGVSIKMRLKIAINNAPDPDFDVDMKIGMGVGPGNSISVFYRSFSTNVDWPWWFDAITLGISKIIENIIEDRIEAKLKPAILNGMRTRIAASVGAIPGVLTRILPVDNAIQLTICN